MNKAIYILIFIIYLSSCSQAILANPKSNVIQNQDIEQTITNLKKGKQLNSQNENFVFLPDVLSAETAQIEMVEKFPAQNQSNISTKLAVVEKEVLQKKGSFTIFKKDLSQLNADIQTRPVVLNSRTQQYGILTGTLIIKFKDLSNSDILGKVFHLKEYKRYAHLSRVVYQTVPSESIIDLVSEIKLRFPEVEIEIEILENFRKPF